MRGEHAGDRRETKNGALCGIDERIGRILFLPKSGYSDCVCAAKRASSGQRFSEMVRRGREKRMATRQAVIRVFAPIAIPSCEEKDQSARALWRRYLVQAQVERESEMIVARIATPQLMDSIA
jgi:hypothetical protein